MGYPAVPASSELVCRYIAHLSEKLSYNSIPKYLNIIRLLHLECGLQNPLKDNWLMSSLLRGVKRHLGAKVTQKAPVTVTVLVDILSVLNLDRPEDCVFWAACLALFYGMLRKSNVLSPTTGFVLGKHLARQDVHVNSGGVLLVIRWSKTIQYRERELPIPLPLRAGHPLCPTTAIMRALAITTGAPATGPAFVYPISNTGYQPLTPPMFVSRLKTILAQVRYDPREYSGHSFRRGGATWAFSCNVPGEIIQVLGDWKSDCYKRYLEISTSTKRSYLQNCMASLP